MKRLLSQVVVGLLLFCNPLLAGFEWDEKNETAEQFLKKLVRSIDMKSSKNQQMENIVGLIGLIQKSLKNPRQNEECLNAQLILLDQEINKSLGAQEINEFVFDVDEDLPLQYQMPSNIESHRKIVILLGKLFEFYSYAFQRNISVFKETALLMIIVLIDKLKIELTINEQIRQEATSRITDMIAAKNIDDLIIFLRAIFQNAPPPKTLSIEIADEEEPNWVTNSPSATQQQWTTQLRTTLQAGSIL